MTLAGLSSDTTGVIAVSGVAPKAWNVAAARRSGVGYVPDDRLREGLFLDQSVARNTNASSLRQLRNWLGLVSRVRAAAQVARWMAALRVRLASTSVPARALSGGNQQRVVLAKVLATNPRVLILNGPTVGVDVGAKEEIHQTIRELAGRGLGVLLISDDLAEIAENCCRVMVLHRGAIVDELSGGAISEDRVRDRIAALA